MRYAVSWLAATNYAVIVAIPKFRAHTTLPPRPSVADYSVQPWHSPDAPNSLVLPRPSARYVSQYNKRYACDNVITLAISSSNWPICRNYPLVDVVVDPVICQHLRDHQRQGVTFMYECVMDLKDYGGEGVLLADESKYSVVFSLYSLLYLPAQ